MSVFILASAAFVIALFIPAAGASQFLACVAPGAYQCVVTMQLKAGDQVTGSLQIVGPSAEVDFWIVNPSGQVARDWGLVTNGTEFTFTSSESGSYVVHFDDAVDEFASENVTMTFDINSTSAESVNMSSSSETISTISAASSSGPVTAAGSVTAASSSGSALSVSFGIVFPVAVVVVLVSIVAAAFAKRKTSVKPTT